MTANRPQIEDSYAMLKQWERARQDSIEMLVHDMRNPLSGILGYCGLIQSHPTDPRACAEFVERIHVLAESVLDMATSMLDASRLEANELKLEMRRVAYPELLKRVLGQFELPGKSQVRLRCCPPVELTCDPNLVERVLANLLSNARRYSPVRSEIEVFVEASQGQLWTRVVDRGQGIDASDHERIFERFAQVGERKGRHSSGLGLSFCKLVIEKHNGSIGVASEPGKGSEFWFCLPLDLEPAYRRKREKLRDWASSL